MRNRLGKYLVIAADNDPKLILLVGDIGFGIFDEFIEKHPDKFINCGIAEQNMIGTAAGLASTGFHVVVYTIIPFLIYRPFDFIRNLIAHQNIPVCLIGVGGGYSYDNLGFTHYGKEDLTLVGTLPNFRIFTPFDPNSAEICFKNAFDFRSPTYIRLMKGGEDEIVVSKTEEGYSIIGYSDEDFTIFTYGSIVSQILNAIEILFNENNLAGKVVLITDIDKAKDFFLNTNGFKFIIEEHLPPGLILSRLFENKFRGNLDVATLFMSRNKIHKMDTRFGILKDENLDSLSIKNFILSSLI
jgi:transketolase